MGRVLILLGPWLTYVALALGAVSRIFPSDEAMTPRSDQDQQQEGPRSEHQHARSQSRR